MKILYLDCSMGAAGDMLTGALLELLPNPEAFLEKINSLGLKGVCIESEKVTRCGILGTHMNVMINGVQENVDIAEDDMCKHDINNNHCHEDGHNHSQHDSSNTRCHEDGHNKHDCNDNHCHKSEHSNSGEKDHHHSNLEHIHGIINALDISDKVKVDACAVYDMIAEAEGRVHGLPAGEVHFHEVGTMDAIADVVSVCMLISELKVDKIVASPVNTGFGQVRCAHGVLPVPAPATANILIGVPVYAGSYRGEMCTPTGAALLKYFVNEFGGMPPMLIENIGYGMGTKEFPQANCVRAVLGSDRQNELEDTIIELACNIDDMTGEDLSFATELLMNSGALDVFIVPIQMKKNRPGQMLIVLCQPDKADELAKCILKHTTTFGVRRTEHRRYILDREFSVVNTAYGEIRVKHGKGYGIEKSKPEYEDIAEAAKRNGVDLETVRRSVCEEELKNI